MMPDPFRCVDDDQFTRDALKTQAVVDSIVRHSYRVVVTVSN